MPPALPVLDATPRAAATGPALRSLLSSDRLRSALQPIWDLDDHVVVGYEALVRGEGELTSPGALFAAADEHGLTAELDRACCRAAFRTAARYDLGGASLFVNVEPSLLTRTTADELAAFSAVAGDDVNVVLEITERELTRRPAELMRTVSVVRDLQWSVALDDVGAEPASLTFLELLRPDVVKLDMSLLRPRAEGHVAEVMSSVNAYSERTGALVLAEGIETPSHLETALSLGARLGQGYLLGRPAHGLVPGATSSDRVRRSSVPRERVAGGTSDLQVPTSLLDGRATRRATKRLLVEMSKRLEQEALRIGPTAVVLSTFQRGDHLTPSTVERYGDLARAVGFTCVLAEDVTSVDLPGVRAVDLAADDPLCLEWDVVVVSPHFAAALVARDLCAPVPDRERQFEYAVTYDRATVLAAAGLLLNRCG